MGAKWLVKVGVGGPTSEIGDWRLRAWSARQYETQRLTGSTDPYRSARGHLGMNPTTMTSALRPRAPELLHEVLLDGVGHVDR
jgi:hypothetical protein